MKKYLALLIALIMLLTCGCGAEKAAPAAPAAPTPEATAEPTPEPTPPSIEMDCTLADVLDADQQDFLASIRSNPPAVASVYLDGKYPETIVLDLDSVRGICTALSGLRINAELFNPGFTAENHVTLTRTNGESITVNFADDMVSSLDSYYRVENSEAFMNTLDEICAKLAKEAAENKKAMESQEFKTVEYENTAEAWKMTLTHRGLETIGANADNWQTLRTTLQLTNTGAHIIMTAKIIAKYLNEDGYVIAEVPDDLNFTSVPILLGEYREFILDEPVYNPSNSEECAASDVIITIVNVNAPNEAGH